MKYEYKMMLKILSSTLTGILGGSMIIPLQILRLREYGHSESSIGLFCSLSWLSMLVASPYVAKFNAKLGYRKTYILTGLISIIYISIIFFVQSYYIWCISAFCIGTVWATRWVTTESFINAIAPADKRGKFIGIYGSLLGTAITIGPAILLLTGTAGSLPFYTAMVLFVISFFFNFLIEDYKTGYDPKVKTKLRLLSFTRANKFILAAAFFGGVFENGISGTSVLYGLSIGLEHKVAAIIPSFIGIGSLLIQYPIGLVADKYKKQNHYLSLSLMMLLASILLFLAPEFHYIIFLAAFCWGVYGPAIYVLLVTKLGGMYKKNDLVAVSAFVIFGYTLGGIIAPVIGGVTIEFANIYGLPGLLLAVSLFMAIYSKTAGRKYRIA